MIIYLLPELESQRPLKGQFEYKTMTMEHQQQQNTWTKKKKNKETSK
jgi:hypothetical protein